MNIKQELKQKQGELRLTDYAFADYLGVSKQLLSAFYAGKMKKSRTIERAARDKGLIVFQPTHTAKPAKVIKWLKGLLGK